MLHRKR